MSRASSVNPAELSIVGIDIGKDFFHLVGFDTAGTIVLRRKIKRLALVATFEKLRRCIACWKSWAGPISRLRTLSADRGLR